MNKKRKRQLYFLGNRLLRYHESNNNYNYNKYINNNNNNKCIKFTVILEAHLLSSLTGIINWPFAFSRSKNFIIEECCFSIMHCTGLKRCSLNWPLYGLFPLRMMYKKFVRGHAYRIVCCAVATLVYWLYARGIVGFLCGRDSIGIQTSLWRS